MLKDTTETIPFKWWKISYEDHLTHVRYVMYLIENAAFYYSTKTKENFPWVKMSAESLPNQETVLKKSKILNNS